MSHSHDDPDSCLFCFLLAYWLQYGVLPLLAILCFFWLLLMLFRYDLTLVALIPILMGALVIIGKTVSFIYRKGYLWLR